MTWNRQRRKRNPAWATRLSVIAGLAGVLAIWLPWCVSVFAQGGPIEARVASLSGGFAQRNVPGRGVFLLRAGDALAPGDELDTRGGARVRIEMSDGSVITVLPGTRLRLKDYRTAGSLRELFEILAGRVRIKVNKYAGKPNPARVNTPSASIAVRGTEFDVIVNRQETRVAVYEGLVEVASLPDARQRVLLEPGRGVIVRPNEELRFFIPGPPGEIGEHRTRKQPEENLSASLQDSQGGGLTVTASNTGNPVRAQAGQYERYIDSVVEPGEAPPLMRFLAFPDSHLDSLENPAYATEFGAFAGRSILLPSVRGIRGLAAFRDVPEIGTPSPRDVSALSQTSVFLPLPNSAFVLGASFTVAQSGVHTIDQNQLDLTTALSPVQLLGTRTTATTTENRSYAGSLLLARRFGADGRTSLGIAVDHQRGNSSLSGVTSLTSSLDPGLAQIGVLSINAREELRAQSETERTRIRLGMTREIGRGHKLGVYLAQGVSSSSDQDASRSFNGLPLPLDSVRYSTRFSEAGMRLRGPLSRTLFYGLEANYLTAGLSEEIRRAVIVDAHERERIHRASVGGAVGFMPWRRLLLNLDLASGLSNVNERFYELSGGNLLEHNRDQLRFVSAHVSMQVELWRRIYLSAAGMALRQETTNELALFPDRFGRRLTSYGLAEPDGRTRRFFTDPLGDLGAGWRFRDSIVFQYVYSTDFGRSMPSHAIVLSYSFGRGEK